MFSNCISLSNLSLKSFKTDNVVEMPGIFYGCKSLISIDLTNILASKTKYMRYMFGECYHLKLLMFLLLIQAM